MILWTYYEKYELYRGSDEMWLYYLKLLKETHDKRISHKKWYTVKNVSAVQTDLADKNSLVQTL